jgi:hypothetical protein
MKALQCPVWKESFVVTGPCQGTCGEVWLNFTSLDLTLGSLDSRRLWEPASSVLLQTRALPGPESGSPTVRWAEAAEPIS